MQLSKTVLINDPALFAYYQFEGDLTDSSPNGRTLTEVGSDLSFVTVGAKYGQAAKSVNGDVLLNNSNPINPQTPFSVVGWFNYASQPTGGSGNFPLFYIADSSNQSRAWLGYLQTGVSTYEYQLTWDPTGLGQQNFNFPITTVLNIPQHVGITFDGGHTNNFILYLNGKPVLTGVVTIQNGNSGSDNQIAILNNGLAGNTPATFDDIAFLTRILTPAEMSLLGTDGTFSQII